MDIAGASVWYGCHLKVAADFKTPFMSSNGVNFKQVVWRDFIVTVITAVPSAY